MSDSSSEKEPTMEEILASIRKIISEDEPREGDGAQEELADGDEALAEADDEDDEAPLDLTQLVGEDGNVVDLEAQREAQPEPPPETAGEAEPEPEPGSEAEHEFELEAVEREPEPEPAGPPPSPVADGLEGLVAAETATSATSAMSLLTEVLDSNGRGDSTPAGADMTLATLVRETLKPHLKAWLDENLPGLVERIVREEIKKMVKRAEYR